MRTIGNPLRPFCQKRALGLGSDPKSEKEGPEDAMRIGIMLRTLDEKYGIGMYTRYILKELLELDYRNQYLLMYRKPAYLGTYAHYPHVQEIVVNAPNKLMWDQVAVPLIARREKLDLLFHTKFTVPLFVHCKTIMVLHGSEWFIYPEFSKWWDALYVKAVMPIYLRRATAVIAVSKRAKEDIVSYTGVNPNKIKTVYLAPGEHFKVIDDEAFLENIRQKYALPKRFILFVGKIYPGKNIGRLLKAFSQIRNRIPHKLVVCGDVYWKYSQDLKLIKKLGLQSDVCLVGWVQPKDLPAIYNLAELFAFPSRYESCPAPPWEAMACGCPVLTSNTGGTPEVVGDAAIFVDPLDVNGLAEAMYDVLTNRELRQNLIKKGLKQFRKFSWTKCASETLDIIENLHSN